MDFQSFVLKGVANASFASIADGDWGAPWVKKATQGFPSDVKAVHVIFANHLGLCAGETGEGRPSGQEHVCSFPSPLPSSRCRLRLVH